MKGIEYEYKKTQKCTEKYLDYTIRIHVRMKNTESKRQTPKRNVVSSSPTGGTKSPLESAFDCFRWFFVCIFYGHAVHFLQLHAVYAEYLLIGSKRIFRSCQDFFPLSFSKGTAASKAARAFARFGN